MQVRVVGPMLLDHQLVILHFLLTGPFWLNAKKAKVVKSATVDKEDQKDSPPLEKPIEDKDCEEVQEDILTAGSSINKKVLE